MIQQIVSRYDSAKVLFECELPEGLESGMAMQHALEKAVERGANLRVFKTDFFDVLLRATNEISGLRAALVAGRVDGSTYTGECACLVGTIAHVRQADYTALGNIKPDSDRPIEQWFMSISAGDTPETNQVSKITVEWIDEFSGLLAVARATSPAVL